MGSKLGGSNTQRPYGTVEPHFRQSIINDEQRGKGKSVGREAGYSKTKTFSPEAINAVYFPGSTTINREKLPSHGGKKTKKAGRIRCYHCVPAVLHGGEVCGHFVVAKTDPPTEKLERPKRAAFLLELLSKKRAGRRFDDRDRPKRKDTGGCV